MWGLTSDISFVSFESKYLFTVFSSDIKATGTDTRHFSRKKV